MYPEKLELLINGDWCQGSEGKSEPLINPATEEVMAEVPHASAADLDRALEASAEGFKVWRATAPAEKAGDHGTGRTPHGAAHRRHRQDAHHGNGQAVRRGQDRNGLRDRRGTLVWRGRQARLWPDRAGPHPWRPPDGRQRAGRTGGRLRRLELSRHQRHPQGCGRARRRLLDHYQAE